MTLRLRYAVRSDIGHVREGNEDSAYAGSRLVAVADGMGGHAAGEVASSMVIQTLAALDDDPAGGDLLDALSRSVIQANATLRVLSAQDSRFDGMGTTVTAMLSAGGRLGIVHVGDSRAYLYRDGSLEQLTHDHTLVQDLVDVGSITKEQAKSHPKRSLLTRALDGRDGINPDVSVRAARLGDRYLLCTDGLSGVVSEETMADALQLANPQAAADRLVELALRGGGPDNVTVVVADVVDETDGASDSPLVAGAAAESLAVVTAAPMSPIPEPQAATPAGAARRMVQALAPRRGRQAGTPVPPTESTIPLPAVPSGPGSPIPGASGAPGGAHADTTPGAQGAAGGGGPGAPAGPFDRAPLAQAPERPGFWSRRHWWVIGGAIVLVLVGVLVGFLLWVNTQYYVGIDNGHVAIYRGINASVLGVDLHSVETVYDDLTVTSLPPYDQQELQGGYPATSKQQAIGTVDRLKADRDRIQPTPPIPVPVPTPTPSPSPSKSSGAP